VFTCEDRFERVNKWIWVDLKGSKYESNVFMFLSRDLKVDLKVKFVKTVIK